MSCVSASASVKSLRREKTYVEVVILSLEDLETGRVELVGEGTGGWQSGWSGENKGIKA